MMSFRLKAWRASSVITLCIAGLLFGLAGSGARAQQDPSRQLTQSNEQRPNGSSRIALVIGNSAYTNAPPLKNPANDARDMAATLKTLGFDVSSGVNVSQREMKRLIREFGQKLKAGGNGLFYYAGHGVQARGRNYIIPVDADIQSEADVEDSGVDVGLVLNYMDDAQNGLNIVILDACRNNPFARSFRSASEGLAQVDAPTGTLIAYATAPGRVAADGAGENGLYTSELLKAMRLSGLSATDMFMQVRAGVMKKTGNKQVPWEASSLVGAFYFNGPKSSAGTPTNTGEAETRSDPKAFELSYWETIKNSTDPEDFKAYLRKYPQGQFSELASRRAVLIAVPKTSSTLLPSVEEVLEANIRAQGGKEAIEKLTTLTFRGLVELSAAGKTFNGKTEMYAKLPDKSLFITDIAKLEKTMQGFDGRIGWQKDRRGVRPMNDWQVEFQKRNNALSYLTEISHFKALYPKCQVTGREKMDSRDLFVVKVEPVGFAPETLYFDAVTGLLYRWDLMYQSADSQKGVGVPMQLYVDEYADVNGVKVPAVVRQVGSGTTFINRFFDFKYNLPIDDAMFSKPR